MDGAANATLAEAVQQVVAEISVRQQRGTLLYDPWRDRDVLNHLDSASSAVASHPVVADFLNGHLLSADRSSRLLRPIDFMGNLVARALEIGSAAAVDDLVRFLEGNETEASIIYCLHGVAVEVPLQLDDRCSIVPADALQPSVNRSRLFSLRGEPDRLSFLRPRLAEAAIVLRTIIAPAIATNNYDREYEKVIEDTDVSESTLGKALAASVLTARRVEVGARYCEHLHPGYPDRSTSVSWQTLPVGFWQSEPIDRNECQRLFRLIQAFQDWPELERLIRRFSRASGQQDAVDAHLDYGVVAESLLTRGDKNQGEIRFRIGTRAAWLLGSDAATRRESFDRTLRLYDLRSAAAHNGSLSTGKRPWGPSDREDSGALCRSLIVKTLEMGRFERDWKSVVFG